MRKIVAGFISVIMTAVLAGCGGGTESGNDAKVAPRLSPESLVTVETVSTATGSTMRMSDEGVVNNDNTLTVTYVTEPIGQGDSVSISLQQFSDTLSTSEIWSEYEENRIKRGDMEFVEGIGEDCYIAYPYIHVYDRGCYIRIGAGSGNNDNQKNLLKNLATTAAIAVESAIPADLVDKSSDNVIK